MKCVYICSFSQPLSAKNLSLQNPVCKEVKLVSKFQVKGIDIFILKFSDKKTNFDFTKVLELFWAL